MKTTIKTDVRQIVVEPSHRNKGEVSLAISLRSDDGVAGTAINLTQDQIGALIVGLEMAEAKAVMQ